MSEHALISPLLDGFVIGNPMSVHDGIRCYPALKENSDEKYIVKIISLPASQVQFDALLLTGACKTREDALVYFRQVADEIVREAQLLNTTAKLEGFLPFEGFQVEPMEDGLCGFQVYLLSTYKRSLERQMRRRPLTHLEAVNLGLDLCAALAICRRSGYLFANLKPSNVFLTKNREFRISDLGFFSLDSLMFTSLPGKYRSPYSPPETRDDMKTLNTTVDTYAVGMILYQIYNDGELPREPRNPRDPFPCPSNADYDISGIIMKAVDPDPEKRWQSPMEMGQALVGYMQRNTVNNTPIAPPAIHLAHAGTQRKDPEPTAVEKTAPAPSKAPTQANPMPEPAPECEVLPDFTPAEEEPADISIPEDVPSVEEPFVKESAAEEAAAEEAPVEELAEEEPASEEDFDDMDFSIAFQDLPEETAEKEPKPREIEKLPQKRSQEKLERARKIRRVLATVITVLILILLAVGGFWFYKTQYLQTIDDLTIEGTQNSLTVTISTAVDTSKLMVSCTDTYGNTSVQPLRNNQATFDNLLPDSLYRVELVCEGFHELQGKTAEIFTTDALINVAAISAMTGPEDGSAMVNFTVDGKDPAQWILTCTAEGEETITVPFTGHSVTVKGMTVGKEYTMTLGTPDNVPLLGNYSLNFLATNLVMAENLTLDASQKGTLAVFWNAPQDVAVEKWTVRCYNDEGHEEVLEIAGTEILFTDIDSTKAYTVEVTASGMSNPTRVSITANPITITDLTVDTDDPDKLTVNWNYDGTAPEGGWLMMYSFAGHPEEQNVVKCEKNQAVITNRIPGATYHFVIHAADSTSIFSNTHSFSCPNAGIFSNQGMNAEKLTAHLLKTPAESDWTAESVGKNAFSDVFQSGDSISVVLKANAKFYLPEMPIDVLYVIRDENGYVLADYISRETVDWKELWYDGDYKNGELDIPAVPTEAGYYNLSIYFNNLAITSIGFEIA